jgi:hypothetical protein
MKGYSLFTDGFLRGVILTISDVAGCSTCFSGASSPRLLLSSANFFLIAVISFDGVLILSKYRHVQASNSTNLYPKQLRDYASINKEIGSVSIFRL